MRAHHSHTPTPLHFSPYRANEIADVQSQEKFDSIQNLIPRSIFESSLFRSSTSNLSAFRSLCASLRATSSIVILFVELSLFLASVRGTPTETVMYVYETNLCVGVLYHRFCAMDPSVLAAMDKEALKKQIENMKYQASMERWPLSKSIAA